MIISGIIKNDEKEQFVRLKSLFFINSSASGILSIFKWLVFNNSSGSFTHFYFWARLGDENTTV